MTTGTNHESEEIVLELPESGLRIGKWTSYSFNSHFLTPTDEFHFTIAHENLPQIERRALESGARVTLTVNGHITCDGYIDDIYGGNDRAGGSEIHIDGRDRLAQAVDSNMDPRVRFADPGNLSDFLVKVFSPFGWVTEDQFLENNQTNRGVLTGQLRGVRTTHKKGIIFKNTRLHQLKPYPNEGVFAFASRIAQRHGLWIWLSAEGNVLIVAKPDFDQDPLFQLQRTLDATRIHNNIISGGARTSLKNQPSIIVAQGFCGGGEFSKSRMTVLMQNPAVDCDNGAILAAYPDATQVALELDVPSIKSKRPRPMYLHDDESHTPEELQNFVRREMALRMRHCFSANYVVSGHTNSGAPWCVDAIAKVDDERAFPPLHEPLWILGRTFSKTRGAQGTQTHLEMIRPHTLVF